MAKCMFCNCEAELKEESLNVISCKCKNCGSYAYEKNFRTTYDFYMSCNDKKHKETVETFIKDYIKNHHVCFVDDFETSLVTGYDLLELRDILNMAGFEVTHNNTIDSNWKD